MLQLLKIKRKATKKKHPTGASFVIIHVAEEP